MRHLGHQQDDGNPKCRIVSLDIPPRQAPAVLILYPSFHTLSSAQTAPGLSSRHRCLRSPLLLVGIPSLNAVESLIVNDNKEHCVELRRTLSPYLNPSALCSLSASDLVQHKRAHCARRLWSYHLVDITTQPVIRRRVLTDLSTTRPEIRTHHEAPLCALRCFAGCRPHSSLSNTNERAVHAAIILCRELCTMQKRQFS